MLPNGIILTGECVDVIPISDGCVRIGSKNGNGVVGLEVNQDSIYINREIIQNGDISIENGCIKSVVLQCPDDKPLKQILPTAFSKSNTYTWTPSKTPNTVTGGSYPAKGESRKEFTGYPWIDGKEYSDWILIYSEALGKQSNGNFYNTLTEDISPFGVFCYPISLNFRTFSGSTVPTILQTKLKVLMRLEGGNGFIENGVKKSEIVREVYEGSGNMWSESGWTTKNVLASISFEDVKIAKYANVTTPPSLVIYVHAMVHAEGQGGSYKGIGDVYSGHIKHINPINANGQRKQILGANLAPFGGVAWSNMNSSFTDANLNNWSGYDATKFAGFVYANTSTSGCKLCIGTDGLYFGNSTNGFWIGAETNTSTNQKQWVGKQMQYSDLIK